jgi:hypothetical protein
MDEFIILFDNLGLHFLIFWPVFLYFQKPDLQVSFGNFSLTKKKTLDANQ